MFIITGINTPGSSPVAMSREIPLNSPKRTKWSSGDTGIAIQTKVRQGKPQWIEYGFSVPRHVQPRSHDVKLTSETETEFQQLHNSELDVVSFEVDNALQELECRMAAIKRVLRRDAVFRVDLSVPELESLYDFMISAFDYMKYPLFVQEYIHWSKQGLNHLPVREYPTMAIALNKQTPQWALEFDVDGEVVHSAVMLRDEYLAFDAAETEAMT